MASRNVPSHIGIPRTLDSADATSLTQTTRGSEPLIFSNIYVSIDSYSGSRDNCNSYMPNSLGQSQSGRQTLHPPSAIGQYAPKAPRVRSRPHTGIFERPIGRHVRPMGSTGSSSASEFRQIWGGHVEHTHGDGHLLSRTPPWYAAENHPCWPGPLAPPFSWELTTLMNTLVISTQPHASTSHLRPGRNHSRLLSFAQIATHFRVEQGAIQTLNAAAEKLDVLKFIVLSNNYENGNRGCYRKLAVCAKANLHLLPGHELPYPDQDAREPEHEH